MKVILINGSPRQNGCTAAALSLVAKDLEDAGIETEIIHAGKFPIRPCTACRYCNKVRDGHCVIADDHVNETADKIAAADGLIIGSPVHFSNMSAVASAFLGRIFYPNYRLEGRFSHKPAAAIACCRRAGAADALDQINHYFTVAEMPVVSSMYWNVIHGNEAEEIFRDEEGVQTLHVLAQNMIWTLQNLQSGKQQGIAQPPYHNKIKTNYIR